MSRREFDARLQDVLDERRSPAADPVLRELARHSAELRAELAAHEAWLSAMARVEPPRPAADFTARVMTRFSVEQTIASRAGWKTNLKYAASIAAAVAAAVVVAVSLNGWRGAAPTAPRGDSPSVAATRSASQPPLRNLAQQAKERYIGLAQETRQSVDGALAAIPRLPLAAAANELPADEPAAVSVADMVKEIKPLGESTAGAVSSLLMAFPLGDNKRS